MVTSIVTDLNKYHRLYGKHSNIPDCCIEFFIHKWPNMDYTRKEYGYRKIIEVAEQKLGKWWRYIPCPDCLDKKHWHKLHYCRRGKCDEVQKKLKKETGYTFPYGKVFEE